MRNIFLQLLIGLIKSVIYLIYFLPSFHLLIQMKYVMDNNFMKLLFYGENYADFVRVMVTLNCKIIIPIPSPLPRSSKTSIGKPIEHQQMLKR